MKFGIFLVLVVMGLLMVFSLANWQTMTTPVALSFLFFDAHAPLGVVMLGFVGLIVSALLTLLMLGQAGALLELRRSARELSTQRELADKAEASRFTELRVLLRTELDALSGRVDRLEHELIREIDESANTLAASLGEIEDRLERSGTLPRS